jgi:DNA-directed RNA polymerase sigma subunit (sigma70/sigma32)
MKKKKMNMTDKRKARDESMINWEKRMEIARLMNQGWTTNKVGEKLGISGQRVRQINKVIRGKTIQELEEMMHKYE